MKTLMFAAAFVLATGSAFAQTQSCTAQAGAKNLAGAAKASFMKKCETDAKAACDKQAATQKLAGAAKSSFVMKCEKDAVGG